jgi:hypothetical protein
MHYKYDLLIFQYRKYANGIRIYFYPFSNFENINQEFQFARYLRTIYARVETYIAVINLCKYLNTEQALYLTETFTPCKS